MKRRSITSDVVLSICVLIMVGVQPAVSHAAPIVSIYTDRDSYAVGDSIYAGLSVSNPGEAMAVAVYIGLIASDSRIYTIHAGGWSEEISPLIQGVFIPQGFSMDCVPLFSFDTPCQMPPIEREGPYCFVAGLALPGTLEFVTEISLAPFAVRPAGVTHIYVDAALGSDSNDGSEGAPFRTITHALASADGSGSNPTAIHVTAGTYAASANGETFPLIMKSWAFILGESPASTTIDAERCGRPAIYYEGVDQGGMTGLTIRGGQARMGGGVHCENSVVTVLDCIVTDNWVGPDLSSAEGGGIYCDNCYVAIEDSSIVGNQVNSSWGNGGGISLINSSGRIEHNTISDNTIYGDYAHSSICGGGAIYCENSSPRIADNKVCGNIGGNYGSGGGGILCYTNSSPEIISNLISSNVAGFISCKGGGIFCIDGGSPAILNNVITENAAVWGGGIDCSENLPRIANNLIANNTASGYGSSGGGIDLYKCWAEITNNTIVDNLSNDGGGIETFSGSATITDCILWSNGDDIDAPWGGASVTYCCISENYPGEGNTSSDPVFVPGPLGDSYLDRSSPCIDAGSRSAKEAGLSDRTTQVDGRPDTGQVDMGYHYEMPQVTGCPH
ncbi:MAG: right-handed parallel beta-helix repeat-containing protein [Candidatus Coatesbacteria bacterium]|nr:right-handed parallel beta-helix repeat-containing protein [Candidatus Coatesbacteria bacterium]